MSLFIKDGPEILMSEADIAQWESDQRYDLVLDHGLLHNMDPVRYAAYRDSVLKALADDDDNTALLFF